MKSSRCEVQFWPASHGANRRPSAFGSAKWGDWGGQRKVFLSHLTHWQDHVFTAHRHSAWSSAIELPERGSTPTFGVRRALSKQRLPLIAVCYKR